LHAAAVDNKEDPSIENPQDSQIPIGGSYGAIDVDGHVFEPQKCIKQLNFDTLSNEPERCSFTKTEIFGQLQLSDFVCGWLKRLSVEVIMRMLEDVFLLFAHHLLQKR